MDLETDPVRILSDRGFRITRPRREIIRILWEAQGALTAAGACRLAEERHAAVGLVTAYRTLELLAGQGLARRVHSEDGCHAYAPIGRGHRHHVLCRACGKIAEFEGCDLSRLLDRVIHSTGFEVEDHILQLVGRCSSCKEDADGSDRGGR